jgi:hypothetical protein
MENYKVNLHISDNESGKKIIILGSGQYSIFFICFVYFLWNNNKFALA